MIKFYNGGVCRTISQEEVARLRNRHMQEETVRMYRSGRLTRYAAEIEMYHMPAVEEQK
jgi:hypothetical protein